MYEAYMHFCRYLQNNAYFQYVLENINTVFKKLLDFIKIFSVFSLMNKLYIKSFLFLFLGFVEVIFGVSYILFLE